MKKIFKQIAVAAMAVIILAGCEDVATNVKMPPAEKKIVVQCFISPDDSVVSALVTWSKPVIGTKVSSEPEFINNAKVEISDGVKTATLLWDADEERYETPLLAFKIEAGKKYFLTVSLPDGKSVSANCIVPFTQNTTLKFIGADTTFLDFGGEMVTCKFNYSDHEASTANYYRIDGKPVLTYPYEDYYVSGEFRQDSDLQAENIFKFMFYNEQGIDRVRAWLINCDYNYYQYHKTLQGAQNNPGIFSEPSIVYTNIDGGLGCFGAYYSYQLGVKL